MILDGRSPSFTFLQESPRPASLRKDLSLTAFRNRLSAGLRVSLACLIFCLLTLPLAAENFRPAPKNGVPDVYIVILNPGVARHSKARASSLPTVAQLAETLARRVGAQVDEVWEDAVQGFVALMSETQARQLAQDPRVRLVEQDFGFEDQEMLSAPVGDCYYGTPLSNTRPLPSNVLSPQSLTCSDPDPQNDTQPSSPPICQDNWGIDRIDQTSVARDGAYHFTNNGRNGTTTVHIYVMDTGIRASHREFLDANGQSRVLPGINAAYTPLDDSPTADTSDCYGHGTHISGIMAGRTYGVAKDAALIPVKIQACPGGSLTSFYITKVTRALNWIVGHVQRPAVINWSGGNDLDVVADPGLKLIVQGVLDHNIVLVQAAGNQSGDYNPVLPQDLHDACDWSFGGSVPGVIVVGGSDQNDGRWTRKPGAPDYATFCQGTAHDCGSNAGACVDVWAPAAHIVSSNKSGDNYYCRLSGTSMAAPHVTGVVALYLQDHPNATPAEVEKALRSRGTWNVMETNPNDPNWIGPFSDNVLLSSNTLTMGPDLPPTATYDYSGGGRTCYFDGTGSSDDFGVVAWTWNFGDGTTGSGPTVQHVFPANFNGRVYLTVTDGAGHTNSFSRNIQVNADAPPTASFTVSCTGRTCTFNGTGSGDDQGITSYSWSFGDSTTGYGATVSHTYAAGAGFNFTATLTVTDTAFQTRQTQRTVQIDLPPVAAVTVTCSGLYCQANASASSDDRGPVTYQFSWNGGGSGFSSTPTSSWSYEIPGTYTLVLTVKDNFNQTASVSETFHVGGTTPVQTVGYAEPAATTKFKLRLYHVSGSGQPVSVAFKSALDDPLTGDWNGDGVHTTGGYVRSTATFNLRNTNNDGFADVTFTFTGGGSTWKPIAGDWNGDGVDTVGLYDPSTGTFRLRNSNTTGGADVTFTFTGAASTWLPIAGDWDGDGIDTVGLYNPATSTFYLRNSNTTGGAGVSFVFGTAGAGLVPVAGDWDGDRWDSIGVYNPSTFDFSLKNMNMSGTADYQFNFGRAGVVPVTGDWDGV